MHPVEIPRQEPSSLGLFGLWLALASAVIPLAWLLIIDDTSTLIGLTIALDFGMPLLWFGSVKIVTDELRGARYRWSQAFGAVAAALIGLSILEMLVVYAVSALMVYVFWWLGMSQ